MIYKELLSAAAIAVTFAAFFPYIREILQGKIKPHVFSWIIWGSTTFIVFLAQLDDGAGVGAWPIGVSGVITIFVAVLAYLKKGDSTITKTDWLFFMVALSSLPLWYLTDDPLLAVVILTLVDLLGFGPTFRKAYARPFEEQRLLYALFALRNLMVIMALEHYSMTTVLFPAAIATASVVLNIMITWRRRVL